MTLGDERARSRTTAYVDLRRRFAAEHGGSALDVGLLPPG
jgi:hypothetical protein